jgi:two-component system KDP operon response regulator KdpE
VTRVLIVDDERQLLRGLRTNLLARGYTVDAAPDGETALDLAARHRPDVVIVDLGLPGIDGLDVIRGLRAWSAAPIIVLSARSQEPEKIAALDAGADDYVTKPFGMGELLARLRAAERRVDQRSTRNERAVVRTDAFAIDLTAGKVTDAGGAQVHLTPTEWHLVELLARHPGKLLTQRELLHEVWGPRYEEETNYLRVYMAQIRRKLEPEPTTPRYFITEPGIGYRFEPDARSGGADDGGA